MISDIVADASFYICFLNDIDDPQTLMKILDHFRAHLSKRLLNEISYANNIDLILNSRKQNLNIFKDSPFEIGEIAKPFFSKSEIAKGEHEVIVIACFCYNLGMKFILIVDEDGPRNFVTKNLEYLRSYLKGTVGFIGDCYCNYNIFDKSESLGLLEKIRQSKFRVSKEIIEATKKRIEAF